MPPNLDHRWTGDYLLASILHSLMDPFLSFPSCLYSHIFLFLTDMAWPDSPVLTALFTSHLLRDNCLSIANDYHVSLFYYKNDSGLNLRNKRHSFSAFIICIYTHILYNRLDSILLPFK